MDDKELTVQRWQIKAQHDLLTARTMLGAELHPTDVVCYHCQQCAEKMLKAYLVMRDCDFPKTHDLRNLLDLCADHDPEFKTLRSEAENLTDYAVQTRYVDDWRDIPVEEATEAVQYAEQFMVFVSAKLRVAKE